MLLKNPILPGFHPDPSICRVGQDYYLVNSTFCYFPGVPIYHSRDLVHWEQIGNVLSRNSQINLNRAEHSGGVYAPTIRWHDGTFYLITTNMSRKETFIVTAQDPKGPWSEPFVIDGAEDMDPSLFFDADGKAYFAATRPNSNGPAYFGDWEIWMSGIDLQAMKLIGASGVLWQGAMKNAVWPEGPHIYRHDGYYYLIYAEGGTESYHSVCAARSKTLFGPYEGNPANPILTHRHLGTDSKIVNVGHGDLVETPDGKWFMAVLGSRPCEGCTTLGRETFLTSAEWQNGWPVINPGHGKVEETQEIDLPCVPPEPKSRCDHFEGPNLGFQWMLLRNSQEPFYSLLERENCLRLYLKPQTLFEEDNPAFLCVRQEHQNYLAETRLEFAAQSGCECAGLAIIQSNRRYIRMEKAVQNGRQTVRVVRRMDDSEEIVKQVLYSGFAVSLKIVQRGNEISFYYGETSQYFRLLCGDISAEPLSTESAGGFVGCCVGLYASSGEQPSGNYADFLWFDYEPIG